MPRLARNRRITGSCKRFADVFGQSGRVSQRPMTRGCCSSRIVAVDALDLLVPVSGPQCPQNKVGAIPGWKEGEPINSPMFAEPVPCLHMARMRVLGKTSHLHLLGREKPLLLFSEFEKAAGRFAVRLCHNTILQLYCGYGNACYFGGGGFRFG